MKLGAQDLLEGRAGLVQNQTMFIIIFRKGNILIS
jgi:hypothetical protein